MEQRNDSFTTLPSELIENIFNYLTLNELIKMESVSYSLHDYIISNKWNQLVSLNNLTKISFVIKNYQFVNYNFSYSNITDESVKLLGNCNTLYFDGCNLITGDLKIFLKRTVKKLIFE